MLVIIHPVKATRLLSYHNLPSQQLPWQLALAPRPKQTNKQPIRPTAASKLLCSVAAFSTNV